MVDHCGLYCYLRDYQCSLIYPRGVDSSFTWTLFARELSPKSALGENHRIGSKVKFDDLSPILYWNAIHSGFKRILRCLPQILSETETKILFYMKNIYKLKSDTFYGPPCESLNYSK